MNQNLKRVNLMAHIWKVAHLDHMLETSWTQMEIFPAVVDCDQMPQEVFYEDDGSPSDDNYIDDERMAPYKDDSD